MRIQKTRQDKFLEFCYSHLTTRILLKPFVARPFSEWMGRVLDKKASILLIPLYRKLVHIDSSEIARKEYHSFNEFFTRKLKHGARTFVDEKEGFPSPCDGRALIVKIKQDSVLTVKHTQYSVRDILGSESLAKRYEGGTAVILRLTVADYHRYCYPVSGSKGINRRIEGIYHTVNPVANDYFPIYKTNTREYTKINSPIYGTVIQMEVGALCVGRIVNYEGQADVRSGQEKGKFEYGGSTIILFLQKDRIKIREDLLKASRMGLESRVRMGELLGRPIGV